MTTTQLSFFKSTEGDKWYSRNKKKLFSKKKFYENEIIYNELSEFKKKINNILHIGCSNGLKLKNLCNKFNAHGNGIDPSSTAINDGVCHLKKKSIKNVKLHLGDASVLPFNKSNFDIVFFGFCLYLIDRSLLNKSIKEADRVLKNGGFLVISDFDPGKLIKKNWGHNKKIKIYKDDYSKYFKKYYTLYKKSYTEYIGGKKKKHFSILPENRVSVQILYK